jgi:hypothetical protein
MTTLPPGTHVIYFGTIRDEYAESYSVEGTCDCGQCTEPEERSTIRYRLHGEHIRYSPDSREYEHVGGQTLIHVDATHIAPSPEGPQPWQINQQILRELGTPEPNWMQLQ